VTTIAIAKPHLYFTTDPKAPLAPQIANAMRSYVQQRIDGANQPRTLTIHPHDDQLALSLAARNLGLTIRHDLRLPIGTFAIGNPKP
jgi:hypothetical protein